MTYFESLSLPEKINYFCVMCPGRALAAVLCFCFSLLALALVVQCFIPALRRLYVRLFRWVLEFAVIRHQLQEYAALLGTWVARLGFSFGLCLISVCMGFFADAASHSRGPLSMSFLIVFGPISFLLMVLAFLLCTFAAYTNWQRLRRSPNA